MQPLATGAALTAYHDRLRTSHDFRIYCDILDLNENMKGSAILLDGQVNITSGELVRRDANLSLSDASGALDFSDASAWSGTSLWVDRLIRVRHVVTASGVEYTAVPFIGPPTTLSRQGAELQVTCQDKGALAMRGARPYTAGKGTLATTAIRTIMSYCTGEFRFRIPAASRRLSKAYSAGLTDEAAPFVVAAQIAKNELGMQLLYSCDGYLTLRAKPGSPVADVGYVTDQSATNADFTTIANYVKVTGKTSSKKVAQRTVATTPVSVAEAAASNSVSSTRLARQGVLRLLPLLITEDAYTKTTQTAARATSELVANSGVTADITASVIPMFHLDADDIVTVHADDSSRTLRLTEGSIPLGVGGEMTIGFHRRVSSGALGRPRSSVIRKVTRPKKKKAKKKRHK